MPTKVITVCVKGMIGRGVVDVDIVDGELIFTLSDGTTVNLGNIMGPKGDPGENATITIGQTTTGDPGTNASVTNTGTETDAVLNFTIPKGVPAGFGTPTAKATTLDPGSDATVKVTASGTNEEKVFSFEFGIPEGLKGNTGDAAGFGTPTASVQTLTPDKKATVSVTATGEDTEKVFDFQFGIPKGDTGDAAGFDTPTATAQTLPSGSNATAAVQASGADTAKKFDFSFGIPKGDKGDTGNAAGFGTPTATASTLDPDDPATASVTSSGEDTEKVFNFTFGIPKGDTGDPAGFDAPSATASTLEAGSSATVSVSASGPDTLKKFEFAFGIPKGDKGDKGDQGEGLDILGTYDTLEALQQAVQNPVQGDIYQIGTVAPYTLYMWDETDTPGWISLGQLQGPTGADGTTFTPSVDEAGNLSWSNIDGKPNPETVNIKGPQGLQGLTGEQGTTFTPSVSAEGVLSWTNDGDAENPDPVNIRGPQGEQGTPGADGAPGQDGAPGVNGVTFTPSVSEDGTISWTNDGNLQNPDSVNIMGPQGAQGNAGPGIAAGGTAGQFLVKSGSADYQTEWKTLDDSAVVNPNLLINADFRDPANPTGQTAWQAVDFHYIEALSPWGLSMSGLPSMTLEDGYATLSGNNSYIGQQVLGLEVGETYTASALLQDGTFVSGSGTYTGSSTAVVLASGEDTTGNPIRLTVINASSWKSSFVFENEPINGAASSVDVVALKLEKGTRQTLAYEEGGTWKLYEAPNRAKQMAMLPMFGYTPTNNDHALLSYPRRTLVGQFDNVAENLAKPWFKFAHLSFPYANRDTYIAFRVFNPYIGVNSAKNHTRENGILDAHIRTDGQTKIQEANLVWEYANDFIEPSSFVMCYRESEDPLGIVAELWVKRDTPWSTINFEVISESGNGNLSWNQDWILDGGQTTKGGEASLPSDMTQLVSTINKLKGVNPDVSSITLTSAGWTGEASPYTQAVTLAGVTANTKVDLQPDAATISQLITDTVAGMYIANDGGTLTAYAVNAKPTTDLTIQVTLTETTGG